jgi:hypothetical protein
MIIYEKRGTFRFRDENKQQHKFATLEEAVDAGGIAPDEEVQVSGVPYKVPAKNINQGFIAEDDEGED